MIKMFENENILLELFIQHFIGKVYWWKILGMCIGLI